MRALLALLAILGCLTGCLSTHPMMPVHYDSTFERTLASVLREEAPRAHDQVDLSVAIRDEAPPRTIAEFEAAELREITLEEAYQLALENAEVIRGVTGGLETSSFGTIYDASTVETGVQRALAEFDTAFSTGMFWEREEAPPDILGRLDTADGDFSFSKRFATGGTARVAYEVDYAFAPLPPTDPLDDVATYNARTEFSVIQPLFRGAGVMLNRAPLLIARARADQSIWEVTEQLYALVRDVEATYWNLHAAQIAVEAFDDVLPLAREATRIEVERFRVKISVEASVAQSEAQLEEFEAGRIQAMRNLMRQESLLRNLLGVSAADGRRLTTKDVPSRARLVQDWHDIVLTAIAKRPEIQSQHLAVRVSELELLRAKNGILPQVDFIGLWRVNGTGEDLNNAQDMLETSNFADWGLGIQVNVPIGNRLAGADARAAELDLARQRAQLRQVIHNVTHQVTRLSRDLTSLHEEFESLDRRTAQFDRFRKGAQARYDNPPANTDFVFVLDQYLQSLNSWTQARSEAAQVLSQYNIARIELETALGTVLENRGIEIMHELTGEIFFGGTGGVTAREILDDFGSNELPPARGESNSQDAPVPPIEILPTPSILQPMLEELP